MFFAPVLKPPLIVAGAPTQLVFDIISQPGTQSFQPDEWFSGSVDLILFSYSDPYATPQINGDGTITINSLNLGEWPAVLRARTEGGTVERNYTFRFVVSETAPIAFSNGWRYRRAVWIDNRDSVLDGQAAVLRVLVQGADLATTANGGLVSYSDNRAFRFELSSGAQVKHVIRDYDDEEGALDAWVQIPAGSGDRQLYCYYGKGSAGNEQSTSVWSTARAAWDFPGTTDLSGNSRTLTGSAATPSELFGPAGEFDGSGATYTISTSWLTGLTNVSVLAAMQFDPVTLGTGRGVYVDGTPGSGDGAAKLLMQTIDAAGTGEPTPFHIKFTRTGGNQYSLAGTNQHDSVGKVMIATNTPGSPTVTYRDGELLPEVAGQTATGTLAPDATLHIGHSARNPLDGKAGPLVFWDRILTATEAAYYTDGVSRPSIITGVSAQETPVQTFAPVAMPIFATVEQGDTVDIDVLPSLVNPGDSTLVQVYDAEVAGTTSLVSQRLRYVADASYEGIDHVAFRIEDGAGRSSTGLARVTCIAATPVLTYTPNVSGLTERTATSDSSLTTILTAFANDTYTTASDYIRIPPGTTLTADRAISNIDTSLEPLIILSDPADLTQVATQSGKITGKWTIAEKVWLHGLCFEANKQEDWQIKPNTGCAFSKFTHCHFESRRCIQAQSSQAYITDLTFGFCRFYTGELDAGNKNDQIYVSVPKNAGFARQHRWHLYRCDFHKSNSGANSDNEDMHIYIGDGYDFDSDGRFTILDWSIDQCYFRGQANRSVYSKHFENCEMTQCVIDTHRPNGNRYGLLAFGRGNGAWKNKLRGCKIIRSGSCELQGSYNLIEGNDFDGVNEVHLTCLSDASSGKSLEDSSNAIVWSNDNAVFVVGYKRSDYTYRGPIHDVLFEANTNAIWKDNNGTVITWNGSNNPGNTNVNMTASTITRLTSTARAVTPLTTIGLNDVGPGRE